MIRIFFIYIVILFSLPAEANESFVQRLDKLLVNPKFEQSTLSVAVYEVSSNRMLYAKNHKKAVLPASTVKWLTAIAAVENFGWEHQFTTSLVTTGPIVDGVVEGDVVIVAGADPTFSSADLVTWAKLIKKQYKIHTIKGNVRIDSSLFADPLLGKGWAWDDLSLRYAAPVSAFSMDRNVSGFYARGPKTRTATPKLYVGKRGRLSACFRYLPTKSKVSRPYLQRKLGQSVVVGHGLGRLKAPAARARFTIPDPASCAKIIFEQALVEQKITIEAATNYPSTEGKVIWQKKSPPLKELLKVMLKSSQNLYAELIVRLLDPRPQGKTFQGAVPVLEKVLRRAGIHGKNYRLADGSGLSRYNLITADDLAKLSIYVAKQPYFERLLPLLPQAGVDGTLARRLAYGPAKGKVYGKTGSMSNVRNIVGYIRSAEDEWLAFSILFTGMTPAQRHGIRLQDAIMGELATTSFATDSCRKRRWWQRRSTFLKRCGAIRRD